MLKRQHLTEWLVLQPAKQKKSAGAGGAPAAAEVTRTTLFVRIPQNRRTLHPDGIKSVWIKAEDLQDRRSHLSGLHETSDSAGTGVRIRYQQHHIGIVMCEPAVLGSLFEVSGIHHSHIWNHDDVRRARIAAFTQMAARTGKVGDAGGLNIVVSEAP